MKNGNTLKKVVRFVCGEFIVLLVPNTLSTLHLSSFYKSCVMIEKKQLLKLSKKTLKIIFLFSENSFPYQQDEIQNYVRLFYEAYSRKNDLTVKELKVLRDFYCLLRSNYSFMTVHQYKEQGESSYYDILDELIDRKRLRKTLN